jgi:hypothetical protein
MILEAAKLAILARFLLKETSDGCFTAYFAKKRLCQLFFYCFQTGKYGVGKNKKHPSD